MRKRSSWLICVTLVCAGVLLGSVSVAVASFHQQKVNEVQLAAPPSTSAQFVELLDTGGPFETFPAGEGPYGLAIFDGAGHALGSQALDATKMNTARADGRPYLVSTAASDVASGITGDQTLTVPLPAGNGQACYTAMGGAAYSCLTWGCVAGPVSTSPGGTGSAAGAVPAPGKSAQRQGDDSVQIAAPTPRALNRAGQAGTACAVRKPEPAVRGVRLLTHHALVSSSGKIRLKFACSSTAVKHCTGRVALSIGRRKLGSVLLSSFTKTSSRVVTVGRAAFRDHRTHRVSVSVRARDGGGRTKTTVDAASLRLPAARRAGAARVSGPAAASSALTDVIRDFSFAPASQTITAGQSVTWTNHGPTDHTATAIDGSFDTGNLHRGQSRTLTFKHAGTFAYICSLHPNMRATLTVKAAASSAPTTPSGSGQGSSPKSVTPASAPTSPTSGGSPASTASASPAGHGKLPLTGTEPGVFMGVGVLLLWGARLALVTSRGGRLI